PGQEGRGGTDVRLARPLLADDDGAAVAAQRERRGPNGVALATKGPAQQPAEVVGLVAASRAVVERREGPDDRRADAGFMPLDEFRQIHDATPTAAPTGAAGAAPAGEGA